MEENVSPQKLPDVGYKLSSKTTFHLLLVGFVTTFLVWYVQFLWKRRKWYQLASRMPGPFAFPLIGCAMHFVGSPFGEKLEYKHCL